MNLIEMVIAAVLFSLSAGSSLQIWSQISQGVLLEEQRQQLADRLDGELATLEANLRLLSRQGTPPSPCGSSAPSLQARLESLPPVDGVKRRWQVLQQEDGLLLELAIEGLPIQRQRLYLPAAMGLCSAAAASAPTVGNPGHG